MPGTFQVPASKTDTFLFSVGTWRGIKVNQRSQRPGFIKPVSQAFLWYVIILLALYPGDFINMNRRIGFSQAARFTPNMMNGETPYGGSWIHSGTAKPMAISQRSSPRCKQVRRRSSTNWPRCNSDRVYRRLYY